MPKIVLPSGILAASAFLIPCLLCIPRNGIAQIIVLLLAAAAAVWIGHLSPSYNDTCVNIRAGAWR